MATNLALDDELLNKAVKVGGFKTKKEAVTAALRDLIRRHEQRGLIGLFGKIEFDSRYVYKKQRRRR